MTRKPSHGWSTAQQGGYRNGSTVRTVYKKPPPVDQALTVLQAAGYGYDVNSLCQNPKCLKKTKHSAANLAADYAKLSNLTLEQIGAQTPCKYCNSENSLLLFYSKP